MKFFTETGFLLCLKKHPNVSFYPAVLLGEYYYFIFLATSTTSGTNVVPASSILTVDQDTLSTMQAEMIAVQVLSQSGDVHLFQKQSGGTAQIVPVTTISSGELQALTQVSNRFLFINWTRA